VSQGANVNFKLEKQISGLIYSILNDNKDVSSYLINLEDVNINDEYIIKSNNTANVKSTKVNVIKLAEIKGDFNLVKEVMRRGGGRDLDSMDKRILDVFYNSVKSYSNKENDNTGLVEIALENGIPLNVIDENGEGLLSLCLNIDTFKLLISKGILDIMSEDQLQHIYKKNFNDVRFLRLLKSSDVILKESFVDTIDGKTGITYHLTRLMKAIEGNEDNNFFELLDMGADLYNQKINGISAYDLLMEKEDLSPKLN